MTTLTGYEQDREGIFIRKSPADVLDYSIDWTDWLPSQDNIATTNFTISTVTGDASPLTLDSTSAGEQISTAYISGGTLGKLYTVTCTITTSANNLTVARQFRILVEERSV